MADRYTGRSWRRQTSSACSSSSVARSASPRRRCATPAPRYAQKDVSGCLRSSAKEIDSPARRRASPNCPVSDRHSEVLARAIAGKRGDHLREEIDGPLHLPERLMRAAQIHESRCAQRCVLETVGDGKGARAGRDRSQVIGDQVERVRFEGERATKLLVIADLLRESAGLAEVVEGARRISEQGEGVPQSQMEVDALPLGRSRVGQMVEGLERLLERSDRLTVR